MGRSRIAVVSRRNSVPGIDSVAFSPQPVVSRIMPIGILGMPIALSLVPQGCLRSAIDVLLPE
jgi:hypothetical protein